MSHSKSKSTNRSFVEEERCYMVQWIDGDHLFSGRLPTIDETPVPTILSKLIFPHPDRPRGSTAMLCAHGAKGRIGNLRPGAWTKDPRMGWHWVKSPSGEVDWIPEDIELPESLHIPFRNDIH